MKKLIEKIKFYFQKVIVLIPDGIENGALKCHYTKMTRRKYRKLLNEIMGKKNDR